MTEPFQYFDAHCHIQEAEFDEDRDDVIARMVGERVGAIVVGTDATNSKRALELAAGHPLLFAAVGVHPTDTFTKSFEYSTFSDLAKNPKVVAIGECGLDYYRMSSDTNFERQRQKTLLEGHIECAVEAKKPLMIHCRAAHEDMIEMLKAKKREYGDNLKGNIHFFTASLDVAQAYFDIDFSVSFSGVITFAREYDEVVREAPRHLILSETDSPFASPPPYRGSRNEPARVVEVVRRIAEIRETSLPEMAEILAQNARRIFSLPQE